MRFLSHTKIVFLLVGILLFGPCVSAQEVDLRTFDYSKADSTALHFAKDKFQSYKDFVIALTSKLHTDQEKFRAIYRWIADNVAYSYSNRSGKADKVVTKRKAVCAGYASLLEEMCNTAGLECNTITGWAKNDQELIGKKEPNHAWNEVRLNGKWYLTDVCWGSGCFDKKKRKFYKGFDSAYFLPTPAFFVKQHLPMNDSLQLLDKPVKKSWFLKTYVWYEGADEYGILPESPTKGCVSQNSKKNFTVKFQLDTLTHSSSMCNFTVIIDGKEAMNNTAHFSDDKKNGKKSVTLKSSFPSHLKGGHCLDIYYGGRAICGYAVNFH